MKFKRYVSISERSVADIAKEIGEDNPQTCHNWIGRNSPVFVEIDPEEFETIKEVYRKTVLFTRKDETQVAKT